MTRSVVYPALFACTCLLLACGGGNHSSVEGKLVDWNGDPIRGITVQAYQVEPISGYELLEGRTRRDGTFRIRGLYPGASYVVGPHSDKWQLEEPVTGFFDIQGIPSSVAVINAAPERETRLIRDPLIIEEVYSIEHPLFFADLATGKFARSSIEGVLADGNGTPVSGVTVVAELVEPDTLSQFLSSANRLQTRRVEYIRNEGIDSPSLETTTVRDGTFSLNNLVAGMAYAVQFHSDKWDSRQRTQLTAPAQHGETKVLSEPISLTGAMSRDIPSLPADVHTGEIAEITFEGSLVDGDSNPIPGTRMVATPERFGRNRLSSDYVEALMQRESARFTTETDSNGRFGFEHLWANARYQVQPDSDVWRTGAQVSVDTPGRAGETYTMDQPMVVQAAFHKESGFRIEDFRSGATRFSVGQDGIITDSETGLEWLVGPDSTMTHEAAIAWAEQCDVAGGGWRLPTQEELSSLHDGYFRRSNRAPAFSHDRAWTIDRTGPSSAAVVAFSRARSESVRTNRNNHVYVVR